MIYDIETSSTFASLLKLNRRHVDRTGLGQSSGQDAGYKAMMKNFDK